MDNQTSQPRTINPDPVQNQAAQPSQLVNQKPPKPFFLNKLFWLVLILILLFAGGGAYLTLNSKPKPAPTISKITPISTLTPTVNFSSQSINGILLSTFSTTNEDAIFSVQTENGIYKLRAPLREITGRICDSESPWPKEGSNVIARGVLTGDKEITCKQPGDYFKTEDTSTWKTYTNALYNISFQYPEDGKPTVVPSGKDSDITINADKLQLDTKVNIQNSREALMGNPINEANLVNWYDLNFEVYKNPQNLSLNTITASKLSKTQPVMVGKNAGIEGTWTSSDVGSSKIAVFNHANKIYVFDMTNDNGEVNNVGEKILNGMLSTLKFTQ